MRNNLMSKKDVLERLNVLGVKANSHKTKAELQKLLGSVEKRKAEKQPPIKVQKVLASEKGEGVKATLYRLFTEDPKLEITVNDLIAQHLQGRKPSSNSTSCAHYVREAATRTKALSPR